MAEGFATLAVLAQNGDGEAYVALRYALLVGEMESPHSHRRPVRCGALEVEEPELPEPIEDLMEVFSEIRGGTCYRSERRPATEVWAYI